MSDAVTWSAMALAIGAVISIITFWTRYSDRLTKAEARAHAAELAAKDAKDAAKEASDRLIKAEARAHAAEQTALDAKDAAKEAKQDVAIQTAAFGLYREKVASEYVQR